MITEMMKLV